MSSLKVTEPVISIVSFYLTTTVSLSTRKRLLLVADGNLGLVFVNSLATSVFECLARALGANAQFARVSRVFRKSAPNASTLDELVTTHLKISRLTDLWYGYLWMDQLSEISVVMIIAIQDASQPVWTQSRTWDSMSNYTNRHAEIFPRLAIQLGVEICVDWFIMKISSLLIPLDFAGAVRRIALKTKMVFCFGIVMWMSVAFWPKCLSCENPQECLLFTECLRDGIVILKGQNACRSTVTYDREFVAGLMNVTGVATLDDLGCSRAHVACYG